MLPEKLVGRIYRVGHKNIEMADLNNEEKVGISVVGSENFIDLTQKIHSSIPLYPGDKSLNIVPVCRFSVDGCNLNNYIMGDGIGNILCRICSN